MTGGDYVASAMRLIGALASGETLPASEAADGLLCLNGMMDSWQADPLMSFGIVIQEFPLVANKQVYTYGPGGDFNTTRPTNIERVSIVSLTNPQQPQEIPIAYFTEWDWQSQPTKTGISTALPLGVYDDGAYPLRNITVQYTPNVISNLRFYVWNTLLTFPDLVTDVTFPPSYSEAIRYNLANRLIAEFPGEYAQITVATVAQLAMDSLARVKSMNITEIQAFCDPTLVGTGGHYNFYTDSITERK